VVIQLEVLQAKNDLRKNSLKEFIGMIAISILSGRRRFATHA